MASMLSSNTVDCGVDAQLGQIKHYEICIFWDCFAQSQDNV